MAKEVKVVKMTIYLPPEIHRALRHASIDEGKSATALVQELIEAYLSKRAKKGVKK